MAELFCDLAGGLGQFGYLVRCHLLAASTGIVGATVWLTWADFATNYLRRAMIHVTQAPFAQPVHWVQIIPPSCVVLWSCMSMRSKSASWKWDVFAPKTILCDLFCWRADSLI